MSAQFLNLALDTEKRLEAAATLLAPWTQQGAASTRPDSRQLDVSLASEQLLPAIHALCAGRWGYLAAITGLDLGARTGVIEILYHFCADEAIVTLRVDTSRADPRIPSVCELIPSADFFERELHEMLGIEVIATTEGQHPLVPTLGAGQVSSSGRCR